MVRTASRRVDRPANAEQMCLDAGMSPVDIAEAKFLASLSEDEFQQQFLRRQQDGELAPGVFRTILPPKGRPKSTRKKKPKPKLGHVLIPLSRLKPSPENDKLYRPISPDDPEIIALADSIRVHGLQEPIVITQDYYILSGHRRHVAAKLAGLTKVPCRFVEVYRAGNIDRFIVLLREYNRQREKTNDERLREEILGVDPTEAYEALIEHREQQSRVAMPALRIVGVKTRAKISKAKLPMLKSVQALIELWREYLPLSDRRIHYGLLNDPPLIHASKPLSTYANNLKSYKALVDLLTRARLDGSISFDAIADDTRPITKWEVHQTTRQFVTNELGGFLKGFWRDLQQSQPNWLEILGEKNTVLPVLEPIAAKYTIPITTGRGYCSLPPRREMAERFKKSGKQKLVLLMVTDFDPDGEEIAHSFARSMRDDFGIANIHPIKVALTGEQVQWYKLPPIMSVDDKDSQHKEKFTKAHGKNVYELESLPPADLQAELQRAIDSVIDVAAFNRELDAERQDAAFLEGVRKTVHKALAGLDLGADGGEDAA